MPSKLSPAGSSPRMRGTQSSTNASHLMFGIIPAYAGNTERYHVRRSAGRDHPRVCGEHRLLERGSVASRGSSPRMRGTHCSWRCCHFRQGIIPAYAGNTPFLIYSLIPYRDHPRVCGEHLSCSIALNDIKGSSPRMRGTRHQGRIVLHSGRIIPAYAGNTCDLALRLELQRDHPRVCGEHDAVPELSACDSGSSPRMRGTRRMAKFPA